MPTFDNTEYRNDAAKSVGELAAQVSRLQQFILTNEIEKAGRYLASLSPDTQAAVKKKLSPSMVKALEERSGGTGRS